MALESLAHIDALDLIGQLSAARKNNLVNHIGELFGPLDQLILDVDADTEGNFPAGFIGTVNQARATAKAAVQQAAAGI